MILFLSASLLFFQIEKVLPPPITSTSNPSIDLYQTVETINLAYQKQLFNKKDAPRITVSELQRLLSDPENQLFCAFSEKKEVIGTLLLRKNELSLFAIHPNYQGKKIGAQLLEKAEKIAFEHYDSVFLKVIPLFQESLILYYESLGYRSYGEYEPLCQEKLDRIQECYQPQASALILRKTKEFSNMSQDQLLPYSLEARQMIPGEIFQHYKGLRYQILHVARHSETLEELVIYQALYGEKDVWARPLSMFLEKIWIDGVLTPRFERVE